MKHINQVKKYLSDTQLAQRYGVHRTTVWRWVQKGDFPKPVKLSPGCTRWMSDAVDQWDEKRAEA